MTKERIEDLPCGHPAACVGDSERCGWCQEIAALQASLAVTLKLGEGLEIVLARLGELREGASWAYQLAGLIGQPTTVLDNLSAIAQGRTPPHEWPVAECDRLRVAETDTARLEAVIANGWYLVCLSPNHKDGLWHVWKPGYMSIEKVCMGVGETPRAAIDKAMEGK
jgi:hypothetical protein